MGQAADDESIIGMNDEPLPFDRARGLGGSDIASILGLSPYRSEWDVWLEKTRDPAWRPQEETAPMRLGKLLEPVVIDMYMERHPDKQVFPVGDMAFDDEPLWHPNGIIFAHPDALLDDTGLLEVKVPGSDRDWYSGVPPGYEAQVRAYLEITKRKWATVAALFRSTAELNEYPLAHDQRLGDGLVRAAENWWLKRVVRGEAPPIDMSKGASAYLATKYRDPTYDEIMPLTEPVEAAVRALLATKERVKLYVRNEAIIKNEIIQLIGEWPRVEGADWHIIFKRTKAARTVAWKEVAKAYRMLFEEARPFILTAAARSDADRTPGEIAGTDLDAIESIFTATGDGSRPFILKDDREVIE